MAGSTFAYFYLFDCPPDHLLDMTIAQMVTPVLFFFRDKGQCPCREKPLPGQFFGGVFRSKGRKGSRKGSSLRLTYVAGLNK